MVSKKRLKIFLFQNRDAVGIKIPRQHSWIAAIRNIRDLSCRKCNDRKLGIIAKHHIEVMKIAPCGAHDDYFLHRRVPRVAASSTSYDRSSVAPGSVSVVTRTCDK